MRYGYTRTSTKDKQDDDLQHRALIDAGVDAARDPGGKFGHPTPDPKKVALNLRTVKHLIESGGLGVADAARTVGWSKTS